jgi:flavin reductase (DIM6/NTAB) family NADH-FMN oxidoreductase RutF
MTKKFKPIPLNTIKDNTFKLINDDWTLITAGLKDTFNTMTASWAGFGILWNKPVVFIFIRPQRHTYNFVEKHEHFTLSFFEENYRDILKLCGAKSGKNVDKVKETGLIPLQTEKGSIFFEQARMVLECRKIYFNDINPANFLDTFIQKNYPQKDYHRMYIGEIIQCLMGEPK